MTTSKNQTDEPVEKRQDNPDVLWVMINAKDKLIREYERRLKVVEDFANVMKDYQRDED